MKASIGDYIIQGVNGEFYPCKPDIFEKTYDLADAPESFLDRVIKEKADLAEKTSKLKDFIDNNPKFDELTNINSNFINKSVQCNGVISVRFGFKN
mgnify:CR=1 FL=1